MFQLFGGAYLGCYAIILGDIEVGENAVVGAGTVVTKSVPANSTIVGKTSHFIKNECEK